MKTIPSSLRGAGLGGFDRRQSEAIGLLEVDGAGENRERVRDYAGWSRNWR
jgi:hypothetical protein